MPIPGPPYVAPFGGGEADIETPNTLSKLGFDARLRHWFHFPGAERLSLSARIPVIMAFLNGESTTQVLRRLVLAVLILALVGLGVELLLLEHTDGVWQLVPLGLIGLALLELTWYALSRSPASLRVFQLTMMLFVIAGPIGVLQHYSGNAEFELEMTPAIRGFDLVIESMTGATPVLAPGTMLQLGLLGLAFAFRHPLLRGTGVPTSHLDG